MKIPASTDSTDSIHSFHVLSTYNLYVRLCDHFHQQTNEHNLWKTYEKHMKNIMKHLRNRLGVHHHLHLVLCISPTVSSMASIRSMSCDCSCLFRCCTVVHVEAWSVESLQGLATSGFLEYLGIFDPNNREKTMGWILHDINKGWIFWYRW